MCVEGDVDVNLDRDVTVTVVEVLFRCLLLLLLPVTRKAIHLKAVWQLNRAVKGAQAGSCTGGDHVVDGPQTQRK